MAESLQRIGSVVVAQAARVDEIADRFELAWREKPQRIEDYLHDDGPADRAAILRQLVPLDVELRRRRGERPARAEYERRFPADRQVIADAMGDMESSRPGMDVSGSQESGKGGEVSDLGASAAVQIVLEVVGGSQQGRRFEFDAPRTFFIGRAESAHLSIADDPLLSRFHLLLEVNPPNCYLRDLGSRSGTIVNGTTVREALLEDGDVIAAGSSSIRVDVRKDIPASGGAAAPAPCLHCGSHDNPDTVTYRSMASTASFVCESCRSDLRLNPPPIAGYEIIERLGKGGMGVVYLARRVSSDERVALKLIVPEHAANERAVQFFMREASVLAELQHPHIVRMLDSGACDGQLFLAMEYVETVRLQQMLARQPLETKIRTACTIACQVLEGLSYAHAKSFVHRDIKPSNVLVAEHDGRLVAKLADFGLAKNFENAGLSDMTHRGDVRGSLPFMAPEQLLNCRDAKPAADIYAVGATLYRLLADAYPHDFPAGRDRYLVILEDAPVPIDKRIAGLSPHLADAVHRALSREPANRFASADEMRQSLLAFTLDASDGSSRQKRQPEVFAIHGEPATTRSGFSAASARRRWAIKTVFQVAAALLLFASGAMLGPRLWTALSRSVESGNSTNVSTAEDANTRDANSTATATSGTAATIAGGESPDDSADTVPRAPLEPIPTGPPMSLCALVTQPAVIEGVKSWTIETRSQRGAIRSVAFSPDGKFLATAGDDSTIRVWDPQSGQLVCALIGHNSMVNNLAWCPDSQRLISGSSDATCRVWDVTAGRLLTKITGLQEYIIRIACSPDGALVAVHASTMPTSLWDTRTGRLVRTLPEVGQDFMWANDGRIAGPQEFGIALWDAESGEKVQFYHYPKFFDREVTRFPLAPDVSRYAYVKDRSVLHVVDVPSGQVLLRLVARYPSDIVSVAWSPDAKMIATGGANGEVEVWSLETGDWICQPPKLSYRADALSWSPDGETLAVGGGATSVGIFNVSSGQLRRELRSHVGPVRALAWSPDGRYIASTADDRVAQFWSARSGRLLHTGEGGSNPLDGLRWSPDGKEVAGYSGGADGCYFWQAGTWQVRRATGLSAGGVRGLDWSPDGRFIVGGGSAAVVTCDAKSGQLLRIYDKYDGHGAFFTSVGDRLGVTAADSKTLRTWDMESGELIKSVPSTAGGRLAVAGSKIAGADDKQVLIWDRDSGVRLDCFDGHTHVTTYAWSPDGSLLASGDTNGVVRVWDVDSRQPHRVFEGIGGSVNGITWSPDGKTLVCVGGEGKIRLWDVELSQVRATLLCMRHFRGMALSPEGHYSGTRSLNRDIVYVVETDEGQATLTPEEFAEKYGWKNDPDRVRPRGD